MTSTVRRMLEGKPDVYSIGPRATVLEALALMAEKNIGALLVMEHDALVGIVSERDYARKVVLLGRASKDTQIGDVMTSPVVCVEADDTAEQCMALMTDHRIRHLPVLAAGRVVGVISIGDVVRAVIAEQADTISHLVRYIGSGS
jgi:CBS domain-containing protein